METKTYFEVLISEKERKKREKRKEERRREKKRKDSKETCQPSTPVVDSLPFFFFSLFIFKGCLLLLFIPLLGEGNGTPIRYSCLENPMDGGAWKAAVHGVAEGQTTTERLCFHFSLSCIGEGNGNPLRSCLENPGVGFLPGVGHN